MALTTNQRLDAARAWARKAFVEMAQTATVNADEIAAAVAATDDWIEANGGAYNLTLPLPFRATATPEQKTLLFCYVALKRAGVI
jgi:hypothetical protein